MSEEPSLDSLRERHAILDQLIWEEEKRLWPDEIGLKRMKLEKLHTKERIDHLLAQTRSAAE
jgi:hypothetical protein